MEFTSILFNQHQDRANAQSAHIPPFFGDLNLDQIVDSITAHWTAYELKPFFYFPLKNIDAIEYRQEVFRDLENETLYKFVNTFTEQMRTVRNYLALAEKLYYMRQKKIWSLYAVEVYCNAVQQFATQLSTYPFKSRGFAAIQKHFAHYSTSNRFTALAKEVAALNAGFAKVKYRIIIQDGSFTVQNYQHGTDYSKEIEETFERFKQGAEKNYLVEYNSISENMNSVEAIILDFVAKLNSELFSHLDDFCSHNTNFFDDTIASFDREIHFYIAYIEHIKKFKEEQLQFCYPKIVTTKDIYNYNGFDVSLAEKLYSGKMPVVCNNFYLKGKERIIVVTGPNQGGKTTFARTFGQLHYIANLGCPVPGSESALFHFDHMFTQFEQIEKVENLRGKLEDDLTRIHSILRQATSNSIIILNEIFNSTTLQDVSFLSKQVMKKILALDVMCVWVTFIDELASYNEQTVSMTSLVVPENPAQRTFKVIRRQADGLAYAMAIAEKYNLTYRQITERIK